MCNDLGRNIIGQIETLKVSAENGCATCSLLYRGIQKIEIARIKDHVRESSLFLIHELSSLRTISSSQSNSPPLIPLSSEQPYSAFVRAAEDHLFSLMGTTLQLDLGTWHDDPDDSSRFRVADRVEFFYTSPSESDSTQRRDR
jgi:hypothetical protein